MLEKCGRNEKNGVSEIKRRTKQLIFLSNCQVQDC